MRRREEERRHKTERGMVDVEGGREENNNWDRTAEEKY